MILYIGSDESIHMTALNNSEKISFRVIRKIKPICGQ